MSASAEQPDPWRWRIRHRARYLNFYLLTDIHVTATTATLTVTYNGLTVLTRNLFLSGFAPVYNWVAIDLDAAPGPFTVGTLYEITMDHATNGVGFQSGFDALTVSQLLESDTVIV